MGIENVIEIIKQGGPAVVAILLAILCWHLNNERVKHLQTIEKMHDEKEAMYREWLEESQNKNERLQTGLSNSTIAITTNSANTDAIKVSLNAIMTFMAGFLDKERRRGE